MKKNCVPMIHVPDVGATVDWYAGIGFTVLETYGDHRGGLSFARLSFGAGEVAFSSGGSASTRERREVDLYVHTDDVDALYEQLRDRVDVVEGPHETFYGMREVIIRDLNRFWITFAELSPAELLMAAVATGEVDRVRELLERRRPGAERLSAALAAAAASPAATEITELLRSAGAVPPVLVDGAILDGYAGRYESQDDIGVTIVREGDYLRGLPDDSQPVRLLPIDQVRFKPIELSDASVTFEVVDGTIVLVFTQGERTIRLHRVPDAATDRAAARPA